VVIYKTQYKSRKANEARCIEGSYGREVEAISNVLHKKLKGAVTASVAINRSDVIQSN
jgi:hypothetical protein